MVTANIAVIWLLGTVLAPEGLTVYLCGEAYDKGVWSKTTIRSIGIS